MKNEASEGNRVWSDSEFLMLGRQWDRHRQTDHVSNCGRVTFVHRSAAEVGRRVLKSQLRSLRARFVK